MTKEERMLIKVVCEEAFVNEEENPYEIYRNLEDCYKSFSDNKRRAYYDCERRFSEDVNYFFRNVEKYKLFTFTRVLSHNQMMFTILQGAYYFSKNGCLVALFRYDTKTRVIKRGFVLNKMSRELITMKKSFSDIEKLIETNK